MRMNLEAPVAPVTDSAHLDVGGKFHLIVDWIEPDPTKGDGSMIENALFRVYAIVLDGTVKDQKEKELQLLFFAPKMTEKNNGEMTKQKIRNFAMAIGCCTLDGAGNMEIVFGPEPGAPDYNEGDAHIGSLYASGRQFVAEIEKDAAKGFMQLRYANVWHVDNPAVKDVPKDKAHLAALPPQLRKTAKEFAKPSADKKTSTTTKPTTPPAPGADVTVNDL